MRRDGCLCLGMVCFRCYFALGLAAGGLVRLGQVSTSTATLELARVPQQKNPRGSENVVNKWQQQQRLERPLSQSGLPVAIRE
jgi:hypothetical protein